jgi:phosphoribosylanthranilate isomerase
MSTRPAFLDGLSLRAPLRDALARRPAKGPVVKICGLSTPDTLEAAIVAEAELVGFVFFPKSPRNLTLEASKLLGAQVASRAVKVALSVDADDALLETIITKLQPDLLQFHGSESPARILEVKSRFGLPVMKAIGISGPADLAAVAAYDGVADRILFDAKPPKGADLPGGNGLTFDWDILKGLTLKAPFMLSGGLDEANVAEAARRTGARAVDVSSGVESRPGQKDPARIAAFMAALRDAKAVEPLGSPRATR